MARRYSITSSARRWALCRLAPEIGNWWAIYKYTPFCNGPDEVKSPSDRRAAELTLLSVVGAEAATLCC
jgi:hypothetical protein